MVDIDKLTNCPKCNSNWDGGSVLDTFKKQREENYEWCKGMTDEQLEEKMKEYYSEPYRWSKLIGVEIQGGYDGVSQWMCPECKARWNRWTGEEI